MSSPSLDTALVLDHAELAATNPVEFRRLLDRIREAAGLNCGQIAVKTGMPRSQAYNLVSKTRNTLPSRQDQIVAFVKACNLAPVQVDIVLDMWAKLNDQQMRQRVQAQRDRAAAGSATGVDQLQLDDDAALQVLYDREEGLEPQNINRVVNYYRVPEPDRLPRNAGLIDLVHYLVANDRRLHRALRLLYPLAALFLCLVGGLVVLAIWQPAAASSVAMAIVGLMATMVMMARIRRIRG